MKKGICKHCLNNISTGTTRVPFSHTMTYGPNGVGFHSFCVTRDGGNEYRRHKFLTFKDYAERSNNDRERSY